MSFPKFLRIAMQTTISTVQLNSTTKISRMMFNEVFVKFIQILAETLGFSYVLPEPTDDEFGRELSNGNWTGIIGMIQRNQADMAVSALSSDRTKVVKFSYPFATMRITFATRKFEYKPGLTAFLGPFSLDVWLGITICLTTMPLALNMLFHRTYRFWNFFWITYGTFIGQAVRVYPAKIGDYLMMIAWMIAITILGYSYKTVLLSFLTFPPLENIDSIAKLANAVTQGRYKCITYPGAFSVDDLARSSEATKRIIGQSLKQNNGSKEIIAVLNDITSGKGTAFIESDYHLSSLKKESIVSDDELITAFLGFPMRKDFCCRARLDRFIGNFWASGLYQKLVIDDSFMTTLKNSLHSPDNSEKQKARQLSFDDFKGIFIILILGYLLSILTFILEVTSDKFKIVCLIKCITNVFLNHWNINQNKLYIRNPFNRKAPRSPVHLCV